MIFGKESKSEEFSFLSFFFFFFGGGGGRGRERVGEEGNPTGKKTQKNKKTIGIRLFFELMLYTKFQVPGSSGSLVLTQTKGVTDR